VRWNPFGPLKPNLNRENAPDGPLHELVKQYVKACRLNYQAFAKAASLPHPFDGRKVGLAATGVSGGFVYAFHGSGLRLSSKNEEVDFDFGPHGEVGGVKAWFLAQFAERHGQTAFADPAKVEAGLKELAKTGFIGLRYEMYWLSRTVTEMLAPSTEVPQDYPTNFDVVWFGRDVDGRVAGFTTGGIGPVPQAVLDQKVMVGDMERQFRAAPVVGSAEMLRKFPRPDDYVAIAQRGGFAYDWSDAVRTKAERTGRYELVSKPTKPVRTSEIPVDIALMMVHLPTRFAESLALDIRVLVPCAEPSWEPWPK